MSRCTNLASADTLGLSDAFVILRLNNTQFARTDVIRDSLNPVFENESFEIPILCGLSSPTLTCEVWDMDNLSVGDFLGNCTINVANLSLAPFSDDDIQLMEVTTPLKNCGKVSIPKRFPSNVDSMHKCPSVSKMVVREAEKADAADSAADGDARTTAVSTAIEELAVVDPEVS